MLYNSILDAIGNTPLIKLNKLKKELSLFSNIYVKVESFNPGGSVKDRPAYKMITELERKGLINKDTVLIEATSGNTGIGLAMVCAYLGYQFILCIPSTMSIERQRLAQAYGANLVLTDGKKGMAGAIERANEIHNEIKNSLIVGQFENEANPLAHYLSTGKEIIKDLDGKIDIFVAGIGTGGTITGVAKCLKDNGINTNIIGVEPANSPIITKGEKGPHKIQGIGAGFIPSILDLKLIDNVITVSNEDAYSCARLLPRIEGILVGISSGAALHVAIMEAKKPENKDKNIVVILPDTGERYLSTDLFEV